MNIEKELEKFLKSAKKPLIIVLGPTASGKTSLSLDIAKKVNGEIISADSKQIYTGMDIATDIIQKKDQKGIPHHLLGIAEPEQKFSLANYLKLALEKISEIYKRKRIPMIVGGTGLYISAIVEGYQIEEIPADEKLRQKLEEEAKKKGVESVHNKLKKLDPKVAQKIHPNNLRYVIRAIEKSISKSKNTKKKPNFDVFMVGISWPRQELYKRVNKRVDLQVKRGLVEEVKKLVKKEYSEKNPSMSALGVKEIIPYIKGSQSLEKCLETLKKNTRHYAKRQITWFSRYNGIKWINSKDL